MFFCYVEHWNDCLWAWLHINPSLRCLFKGGCSWETWFCKTFCWVAKSPSNQGHAQARPTTCNIGGWNLLQDHKNTQNISFWGAWAKTSVIPGVRKCPGIRICSRVCRCTLAKKTWEVNLFFTHTRVHTYCFLVLFFLKIFLLLFCFSQKSLEYDSMCFFRCFRRNGVFPHIPWHHIPNVFANKNKNTKKQKKQKRFLSRIRWSCRLRFSPGIRYICVILCMWDGNFWCAQGHGMRCGLRMRGWSRLLSRMCAWNME